MPSAMDQMLEFNAAFVANKEYAKFLTGKLPDKNLAVLSCMDTRLTELLPAALDFKNGDIKLITNAGALVSHPFGSVMRSLMVCVYTLGVREIAVIGHHDCGMQGIDIGSLKSRMIERGIPADRIEMIEGLGMNLDSWFKGFDDPAVSVRKTVKVIRNHPLMPDDIEVRGFLINPYSGALAAVPEEDGA